MVGLVGGVYARRADDLPGVVDAEGLAVAAAEGAQIDQRPAAVEEGLDGLLMEETGRRGRGRKSDHLARRR